MRRSRILVVLTNRWAAATLLSVLVSANGWAGPNDSDPAERARPAVSQSPRIDSLNGFVENRGQWPIDVKFFARTGGIEATLVADAIVLRPAADRESGRWPAPVILRLPRPCAITGEVALPTLHHFLKAERSASDVRGFERAVYRDVVAGVDLVLRTATDAATGKEIFEYDLVVASGAHFDEFVIEVEGAFGSPIVTSDTLTIETSVGPLTQRIGAAWQTDAKDGPREPVASRFRVLESLEPNTGTTRFGFEAPGRDPSRAFVLDPGLVFSTYVGGSSQELFKEMAVDGAGVTYLTCRAFAATPTTPGAIQPTAAGEVDAWIGKLSADGKTLVFGTYLGGSMTEEPFGIEVDQDGTIVVAGNTWSANFPTTGGVVQATYTGIAGEKAEMFATRLNPSGSQLVWSTYYGGSNHDLVDALALFPDGDILLAGESFAADPSATSGAFDSVFNPHDRVLIRISADGRTRLFQTYFQASHVSEMEIDAKEDIYFAGYVLTQYHTLPATPGAFKTSMVPGDSGDGFVAKIKGDGTTLYWATLFGGDANVDSIWSLAIDAASAIYVGGQADSIDFPTTVGAFDSSKNSLGSDGFVAKLLPGGTALVWSTYFGACCGQGQGYVASIAADVAGNAYVVGSSNNPVLPVTFDAIQSTYKGVFPSGDAFLAKFDAFGEALIYSTWIGGFGNDSFTKVALGILQRPHLVLQTGSLNFPTTTGSYDTSYAGSGDIAVSVFDLKPLPWTVLAGGLKGGSDTPSLAGGGWLVPGGWNKVEVRGGPPSALAFAIAGLSRVDVPALGGILIPSPDFVIPMMTDGFGRVDLPFVWPTVPSGGSNYVQFWISDPGAPNGWSATNGLRMIGQ